MSRLKPIGFTTTSIPLAILPAIEASTWLSPGLACGKLASAQSRTVVPRMMVPGALQEDHRALVEADDDVLDARHLVLRQLHHERAAAALGHRAAQGQSGEQRTGNAGDIKPEHHQSLQTDARADVRSGMKAAMINV